MTEKLFISDKNILYTIIFLILMISNYTFIGFMTCQLLLSNLILRLVYFFDLK